MEERIFEFLKVACGHAHGVADKYGNNEFLLKLLRVLHPHQNRNHADLVLRILNDSSVKVRELYTVKIPIAFFPDFSVAWLSGISFVGKILDLEFSKLSEPSESDTKIDAEKSDGPTDKELTIIPSRVLPKQLTRTIIAGGISHESKLVVFTMAQLLIKVLRNVQKWIESKKVSLIAFTQDLWFIRTPARSSNFVASPCRNFLLSTISSNFVHALRRAKEIVPSFTRFPPVCSPSI